VIYGNQAKEGRALETRGQMGRKARKEVNFGAVGDSTIYRRSN